MIASLIADLLPWAIGVTAAILSIWGYGRARKAKGREETYIETLQDSAKRQEAGREAVSDLRGANRDDNLEQLHRNDSHW